MTITGPNTGGKTAALKTLGLAVVMSKMGMYIPSGDVYGDVDGAAHKGDTTWYCPWFDGVFVDVGDTQDMQQNLSTFSGHISRIQRILNATSRPGSWLVLLDELGSGTDPTEGSLLGASLLEELRL